MDLESYGDRHVAAGFKAVISRVRSDVDKSNRFGPATVRWLVLVRSLSDTAGGEKVGDGFFFYK